MKELRGETDADGRFAFQFQLPELPDDAFGPSGALDLALEATVVDATGDGAVRLAVADPGARADSDRRGARGRHAAHGRREHPLRADQLSRWPAGGHGAPGADRLRRADRGGHQRFRRGARCATRRAPAQRATARSPSRPPTRPARPAPPPLVLPLDEAQETLLLRTDRALYQVGDTLAVEAIATGSGPAVYLDVIKGGQTLLTQSALVEDGKATLAIDLTPALAGTLELNAYQLTGDNNILRDTRVALVDAPEAVQVQLATDQAEYRPGQQAELSVRTTADGEGVQTAVGLAVVNEAVYGQRAVPARLRPRLLPAGPGAASERRGPARRRRSRRRGAQATARGPATDGQGELGQLRRPAVQPVGPVHRPGRAQRGQPRPPAGLQPDQPGHQPGAGAGLAAGRGHRAASGCGAAACWARRWAGCC